MLSRPFSGRHALTTLGVLFLLSAGISAGQTISIVSGNGQLVAANNVTSVPLVVVVRDSLGNPIPGYTVNWTSNGTGSLTNGVQTTTDANGQASNGIIGSQLFGSAAFTTVLVVATAPTTASTVSFSVISYNTDLSQINSSGLASYIQAQVLSPSLGTTVSGTAGTPGATPIQVQVKSILGYQAGAGLPGVSVTLMQLNGTNATIACQGGPVYTDANGSANCTPVFGGIGTGQFQVIVGSSFTLPGAPLNFSVVAGQPAMILISSGNNQTGVPGMTLGAPFVGIVTDAAGNPLSGQAVTFTSNPASAITFTQVRTPSDSAGKVSAIGTLAGISGAVKAHVALASNPAIGTDFNVTVNVTISGFTKMSGDTQSAITGTAFATPLVIRVSSASGPVPGVPVTFTVTQGAASLTPTTVSTDTNGLASATVTAGASAGPVVVTATAAGGFSATFNLTVNLPGPVITSGSFSNGASFQTGSVSPCSIATITGSGIAPNVAGTVSSTSELGLLLVQLATVSVQFNGIFAPIYNVTNSNGQQSVTVQVPCEIPAGQATVLVTVGGGSATVTVPVQAYSPGLFSFVDTAGQTRAIVLDANGRVVTTQNPATRGATLRLFATGLGQTAPTLGSNQFSPLGSDAKVNANLLVGVNNEGVPVTAQIYARNLIGVYEVDFQVPSDIPSGPLIPLALAVIDPASGNPIFATGSVIAIQ